MAFNACAIPNVVNNIEASSSSSSNDQPWPLVIPFTRCQGPSHPIERYDPSMTVQPLSVPAKYIDAMRVRNAVFVDEQRFPLNAEPDADDPRSYHLVLYSPLDERNKAPVDMPHFAPRVPMSRGTEPDPIGTIRIIPYPHLPHPEPGSDIRAECAKSGPGMPARSPPEFIQDRETTFHDGIEPYLKLGRLAVVKPLRKRRLGAILVQTALKWILNNSRLFNPPYREISSPKNAWNGLVCVHTQLHQLRFWQSESFKLDESMGTWFEEGVPHVGVFTRLQVGPELFTYRGLTSRPGSVQVLDPRVLKPTPSIAAMLPNLYYPPPAPPFSMFNALDVVEDAAELGTVPLRDHHLADHNRENDTYSGFGLGEGENVPSQKGTSGGVSSSKTAAAEQDATTTQGAQSSVDGLSDEKETAAAAQEGGILG